MLSQSTLRKASPRQCKPFASNKVCISRLVRVHAGESGPSAPPPPASPTPASSPRPAAAAPRPAAGRPVPPPRPGGAPPRPGVMLGPDGQPLEVVPVEKTGAEAWAGVAMVDDGARSESFDLQSALLLAAGDVAVLLVFALAGRANHGGAVNAETLGTALPFIIGWFATAPFLGGFSADARKKGPATAAATAAKCWAAGVPLGLVLRGLSKGYVPPVPFILVSLGVTGVLLTGWRAGLAAVTKQDDPKKPAVRKDKRGNPFEFLELLMSLTKRW